MITTYIAISMLLALFLGFYIGLKNQYTAQEGTLAIILLEILFIAGSLLVYDFVH